MSRHVPAPDLFDLECGSVLGGTVIIGPTGRDQLGPARLLNVRSRDPNKPFVATVSFDVKAVTAIPNLSTHRPRLRLAWGSDLGGGEAFMDLRHGLRISLEVSDIVVDALYGFQPAAISANAGPDLQVVASIGFGSVGPSEPTLTADSEVVPAAGSTTFIQIPSYARQLEVQSSADPFAAVPNAFGIEVFRGSAAGIRMGFFSQRDLPITLANGVETVRITNNGPGAATYTPIFHLAL